MAEVTLIRCIGCGTPLGNQVPSEGALEHVRKCERHPLARELAELREAVELRTRERDEARDLACREGKAREAAERRASGVDLVERVLGMPLRVDPSLPAAVEFRLDPPYRTPTQAVDAIRAAASDEDARDVLLQYVRQERAAHAPRAELAALRAATPDISAVEARVDTLMASAFTDGLDAAAEGIVSAKGRTEWSPFAALAREEVLAAVPRPRPRSPHRARKTGGSRCEPVRGSPWLRGVLARGGTRGRPPRRTRERVGDLLAPRRAAPGPQHGDGVVKRRVHRAVLRRAADGDYDPLPLCGARWTMATVMRWDGRGITCPRCASASTSGFERVHLDGGGTALRDPTPPENKEDPTP